MKILYKYVNKYNGICINKNGKYEPFEGSQHVLLRALGVFTSSHPHHKRVKEPPPHFSRGGDRDSDMLDPSLKVTQTLKWQSWDSTQECLAPQQGPWPLPHCLSDWAVTSWWVTNQCGRFSVVFQKNEIE